MNAIEVISQAARAAGYRSEAIIEDYAFADVLDADGTTRVADLAAFTQSPPSYRSAALAAVRSGPGAPDDLIKAYRALGAPLLFVISELDVAVWEVRNTVPSRVLNRLRVDQVPALFERKRSQWNPEAIHRAKTIGAVDREYQLDFVDLGLLPAIEGEIHTKLDRLLAQALETATTAVRARGIDPRDLFRVVFRLLAAKVLQDRKHPHAGNWNGDDLPSVLRGIESYYSLPSVPIGAKGDATPVFEAAWSVIRRGISFSNISADDLAFVYENTLVTPETRKHLGTHGTPAQVAEYVVSRLQLHKFKLRDLRIYEPFAGAAVFLVSALRHLRDLLPAEWSDEARHQFLVQHLAGDEIDPFACEVATLSLILADYPAHNGWHIETVDLFEGDALRERMAVHNLILCNPPFQAFPGGERDRYPVAQLHHLKAAAALDAALDMRPQALGFVLPRSFILGRRFGDQRRRVERLYGEVELVQLPEGTFQVSGIEAALLIAREPRPPAPAVISLRSTEVADRGLATFLKTGGTSATRQLVRPVAEPPLGDLWIPALTSLWDFLASYPRLNRLVRARWGLQWTYDQRKAFSDNPRPGFVRGLHNARGLQQFTLPRPVFLDYRSEYVRRAFGQPWDKPKIILNAARVSRGSWRIAAAVDHAGLAYSQQFFGLWPLSELSEDELLTLAAVLNGPIANAFVTSHSPAERFRATDIGLVPIPPILPSKQVGPLAREYLARLADGPGLLAAQHDQHDLGSLLTGIDGAVLAAYDLAPKIERELLEFFRDAARPVPHPWMNWDVAYPSPALRLSERLSGAFRPKAGWILDIFRPLPEEEAELLRKYGP